jgi:hypothetical protein
MANVVADHPIDRHPAALINHTASRAGSLTGKIQAYFPESDYERVLSAFALRWMVFIDRGDIGICIYIPYALQ